MSPTGRPANKTIGFVGLGNMGQPMAGACSPRDSGSSDSTSLAPHNGFPRAAPRRPRSRKWPPR